MMCVWGHALIKYGREKLYKFFMSLKQPDGSFIVSHHGEVDVRYGFYYNTGTLADILITYPAEYTVF